MKKQLMIFALLTTIFAFSCKGDDDDGGAGAEFDAALYYTKTESDARYLQPMDATSAETIISGTGYGSGMLMTLPENSTLQIVQVEVNPEPGTCTGNGEYEVHLENTDGIKINCLTTYVPNTDTEMFQCIAQNPSPANAVKVVAGALPTDCKVRVLHMRSL